MFENCLVNSRASLSERLADFGFYSSYCRRYLSAFLLWPAVLKPVSLGGQVEAAAGKAAAVVAAGKAAAEAEAGKVAAAAAQLKLLRLLMAAQFREDMEDTEEDTEEEVTGAVTFKKKLSRS